MTTGVYSFVEKDLMRMALAFRIALSDSDFKGDLSLLTGKFARARERTLSAGYSEERVKELLDYVIKMEKEDRVAELQEQL